MKKNIIAFLLTALVVGALGFALAGCGGGMPEYAGVYQLTYMEAAGVTLEGADLEAAMEASGGIEEQYIEIKDGSTLSINVGGGSEEASYRADGDTLTFQDTSGPSSFILDGDTLTWEVSDEQASVAVEGAENMGFTMVFTKK